MVRKIIQVAMRPSVTVADPHADSGEITFFGATLALCDDGTLWVMHHQLSADTQTWVQVAPIPQY